MVDWRRFVGAREEQALPWFGEAELLAPDRRLRLAARPTQPGWWRFAIEGRTATPLGPAEPEGLEALPRARGHLVGAGHELRLVGDDAHAARVWFAPADEPPPLAPCTARRWPGGQLLFEQLDFEGEPEEAARRALEEGRGLQGVKGVPASLRAAFAYALAAARAQARRVTVDPLELRARAAHLAEGGPAAVDQELARIEAERRRWRAAGAAAVTAVERALDPRAPQGRGPAEERAATALRAAGAELLRLRRLAGEQLEVVYRFLDTRFVSVVDARTLQVIDAGVCLSDQDDLVTLESLPGVIREGAETGQLVILRRPD